MRLFRWFSGLVLFAVIIVLVMTHDVPFLFYQDLPNLQFIGRALFIMLLAALMCLYRVLRGPTAPDRIVAVDIMGVLIVGFCAMLTISTQRSWYIDIAMAWQLQGFVSVLALSKYLEGKGFDE
jgi:multicomponent Na+:H+ antiporter subunit F